MGRLWSGIWGKQRFALLLTLLFGFLFIKGLIAGSPLSLLAGFFLLAILLVRKPLGWGWGQVIEEWFKRGLNTPAFWFVAIAVAVGAFILYGLATQPEVRERRFQDRETLDSGQRDEAWEVCQNASNTPTQEPFEGKVYPVYNTPADTIDKAPANDEKGFTHIILVGNKNDIADSLNDAGAILCAFTAYELSKTCFYREERDPIVLRNYSVIADIRLVAWPSGKLIAATSLDGGPGYCPPSILNSAEFMANAPPDTVVNSFAPVAAMEWLAKYRQ